MIILSGNPISTGTIYRYAMRGNFPAMYMTKRGKDRKEQYQWEAKSQWKKPIIKGDIRLKIRLFFGTKRKADWDNFHKLTMDAMQGIVYEDDCQIQEAYVSKHYDKENPRIEIEIMPQESE